MAYTDGYDYDIFISYSHDDDAAPEGRNGWVTEFYAYLNDWLVKKRHLKGLKIWFDAELNGNTVFDRAIEDRIGRSALFFVLHSNNYKDSEYCRKELEWFFQHNQRRPEGLMVGDESRLLNLLINNIPYTEWPEALSEACGPTSRFVLHDAGAEGEFGYPTSLDDSRFDRQLRKLVEATAKQAFAGKWFSPAFNTGGPVAAVAFSPDGTTLLSGSGDKTLRLWDATGFPLVPKLCLGT